MLEYRPPPENIFKNALKKDRPFLVYKDGLPFLNKGDWD